MTLLQVPRKFCGFVLQCQHDSFPDPLCNFRGFILHCQHNSFPDPSYNFCGFVHDFSPGLSCSCQGFVLHCQHGSSLKLLDNSSSFCQHIFILVSGVTNLLQNINSHKATGPGGIPAYFLKEFSNEIAPILTLIFQCSIQQGTLLDEWKTANIIGIFKKVDRTSTDNYHPVSLILICCKLIEHIIAIYSSIFVT